MTSMKARVPTVPFTEPARSAPVTSHGHALKSMGGDHAASIRQHFEKYRQLLTCRQRQHPAGAAAKTLGGLDQFSEGTGAIPTTCPSVRRRLAKSRRFAT